MSALRFLAWSLLAMYAARALPDSHLSADVELPLPFLVVVVLWLIVLFGGYGLIAARNPTVLVFLLACTLSVAGAVFLIQQLADPFEGMIRVSSVPLSEVISQFGR